MAQPSRGMNISAWVASVALAALFVFAGYSKVTSQPAVVEGFRKLGYSDGFRVFIGVCELAGGIGLLIPRLATWAGAGLIVIMVGAIYTELSIRDFANALLPLVVGALCGFVARTRRSQALFAAQPGGREPAQTI